MDDSMDMSDALPEKKAFSGTVKKMELISKCLGYVPCPNLTDEAQQHLIITADGNVSFFDYSFGDGKNYSLVEKKDFKMDPAKATRILLLLGNYFSNEFNAEFITDVGSWKLVLTNEEDKDFIFTGCLYPIVDELISISEEFRASLEMPKLLMFDGENEA